MPKTSNNVDKGFKFDKATHHSTEVGRAFLIHFQKLFLNKVFLMIKIAREFSFYTRMVTSGIKSVKKGQKMLKKATIWSYIWFF